MTAAAWVFVILIADAHGAIQSEAFDWPSRAECEMRRDVVVAVLTESPIVYQLYVGECKEIKLATKT